MEVNGRSSMFFTLILKSESTDTILVRLCASQSLFFKNQFN